MKTRWGVYDLTNTPFISTYCGNEFKFTSIVKLRNFELKVNQKLTKFLEKNTIKANELTFYIIECIECAFAISIYKRKMCQ